MLYLVAVTIEVFTFAEGSRDLLGFVGSFVALADSADAFSFAGTNFRSVSLTTSRFVILQICNRLFKAEEITTVMARQGGLGQFLL